MLFWLVAKPIATNDETNVNTKADENYSFSVELLDIKKLKAAVNYEFIET